MKKIIAISFLFMFLCANTEIGQLLKLPNLIEHFYDHCNTAKDTKQAVSFIDFVKIHYNSNQKNSDTDKHDDHQNLPFKTINKNINTILAFETHTCVTFKKPILISIDTTLPYYREFYTSDVHTCIWLPPKLS